MPTTNSIIYESIRVFRDTVFERIRENTKKSSGAKYLTTLRDLIGKDRWDAALRSAKQLRTARVFTQPLLDDFDAQDVTDLPRIFEKQYDSLVDVKGRKQELLTALEDISFFRNGIAHPAFVSVPLNDARRLAERISTASNLIFGEQTKPYSTIAGATAALFEYQPAPNRPLPKSLPPRQEVVGQFIGRERELRTLYSWLESPVQLWVLEGDGGKGKSSLAFVFCESLETAGDHIERVIWLTAKLKKFQDGSTRGVVPDFTDLTSAQRAVIAAYGFGDLTTSSPAEIEELAMQLLQAWPALIVIDDVDSLESEDDNVAYWFTNVMARYAPACKVILTTRRALYGLGAYTSKIEGLNFDETKRFIRNASERIYNDADRLGSGNIPKLIYAATEGSPLYLEDIVRLILVLGKPAQEVVSEWKSVRHDVREYALRREFEMLSQTSKEVLLAAALAGEPISRAELLSTLGGSEDSFESAIAELQRFFLISPPDISAATPTFEINRNLGILVKVIMQGDSTFKSVANALRQVRDRTGKPRKIAKDAQRAIWEAVALVTRDRHVEAEVLLKQFLIKYPEEGALLSHLGWVMTRWPGGKRQTEAASVLQRAVDVKHKNQATYINLGQIYLDNSMFEKAESVLSVGVDLFPDDLDVLLLFAQAQALSALELAGRIDSMSSAGISVVLDPLQTALREVMAVRKKMSRIDSPIYRTKIVSFGELDTRLRSAIAEVKATE